MQASMKKILFAAMALTLVVSACVPSRATPSVQDVQGEIGTAVALTVAAQSAQTQAAASLVPPATNTTLPTQTPDIPPTVTAIIPTVTPLPPPTRVPSGGGGKVISTEYSCNPFPRKPADGTIFKPNDEFDIKWTIVNTGTKPMHAGLDLKYNIGTKLTSTTLIELPELEPGDQYIVVMDAKAPAKEGTYTMAFIVEGGLCYPYTTIVVEKK